MIADFGYFSSGPPRMTVLSNGFWPGFMLQMAQLQGVISGTTF